MSSIVKGYQSPEQRVDAQMLMLYRGRVSPGSVLFQLPGHIIEYIGELLYHDAYNENSYFCGPIRYGHTLRTLSMLRYLERIPWTVVSTRQQQHVGHGLLLFNGLSGSSHRILDTLNLQPNYASIDRFQAEWQSLHRTLVPHPIENLDRGQYETVDRSRQAGGRSIQEFNQRLASGRSIQAKAHSRRLRLDFAKDKERTAHRRAFERRDGLKQRKFKTRHR
jgi:hypothetical protein